MISAEKWNLLVDAVNALLQPASSGASSVGIFAAVPSGTAGDPFAIGGTLQIVGQNFGYALGLTTVAFIGPGGRTELAASNLLPGSSDTRLVLTVPSIPGVTTSATSFSLVVSNGSQNTTQTFFARVPSTPLNGDLFVNWRSDLDNPDPNPVVAGSPADFAFTVRAATNKSASVGLVADIRNASATIPGTLIPSLQIREGSGVALRAGNSLDLQAGESRNLVVRVPRIPSSWDQVSFTLVLTASAVGLEPRSDSRPITVGDPTESNNPDVTANQTGVDVFDANGNDETNPANFSFDGSTIRLRAGRELNVEFAVQVSAADTYTASMSALRGWTSAVMNSTNPFTSSRANDPTIFPITIAIGATAGATAAGTIEFKIKGDNAALDWVKQFTVELIA